MASATVDASITTTTPAAPATEPPLFVDSIPTVDLRCLSQSELYSLSLCSPSAFDPLRRDDVVIPKIDRAVFNESAGSRKQTYSRLRLAPASSAAAAGAAASTSSLRRRTPHLRHTSNIPYHYLDSDPEKGENQQILELFKQLFGLDNSVCIDEVSHEDLVPIRVDYSDSLPQLVTEPRPALEFGNVGLTGQKRKRGRPRKIEDVPLMLVENKVESELIPFSIGDNLVSPMDNQVLVCEKLEENDRDREIVNKEGVEVDLVALGGMHDPYEPELIRRTQGMTTEEALLEFLQGLDGRWGSRRKKRRIVDANLFGNVLPNGWSLLLSVKKKDGHVWLFCRRYLSPTGRQFESCKEISSYLLSLRGIQDANQLSCTQSNPCTETANSVGFQNTVDLAAGDQVKEVNPVCQVVSPDVALASGNFQVEVILQTGDLPAAQVGEILHCAKCNMSFTGQNDYFQHQLSSHRRKKPKGSESITDGVILTNGKFECQFCHKTFTERHRYNGHIGAHVRYEGKASNESQATPAFDLIPQSTLAKTSLRSESNVAGDILRTDADHVLNSNSPHNVGEQCEDFKESDDKVGVHEAMDVDVSIPNLSFKSVAALENQKNSGSLNGVNIIKGLSDGTDIDTGNHGGANVAERIEVEIEVGNKKSFDMQGMETESPSFPLDGKTVASAMNIMGISVDLEEAQQKAVCGSVLLGSKENLGSSEIDLVDVHLSCTDDELRFEGEKYATHESVSDYDDKPGGLDASSGIGDQQNFESEEDHLCKLVGNLDEKSIYTVLESERDIGSGYSILVPSGDRDKCSDTIVNDIFPRGSSTAVAFEHGDMNTFVTKECCNTGKSTKQASTSLQEEGVIGNSTVNLSLNEQVNFAHKYNTEVSSFFGDSNMPTRDSRSSFSDFGMNSGVQQYVDGVSARQMEQQPKVSETNYVTNDDLIFPFSSRNNKMKMDAVRSSKPERKLEFRSFFPSENAEDGVANFHEVEGSKNQHFLAESLIAGASHADYNVENIYATQVGEPKLNDSGMKQMLGVQGDLNINSHIGPVNPKEVRAFGFDLHGSAFSDRTYAFENNINMIYPGKVWEGPKIGEFGNSRGKFVVDFGSGNPQPVEGVMSGSTWRAGEENLLHTGPSDTSAPHVQSSTCFRNFDIISDKGEGLFGADQKYDGGIGFEGLRLGRTEPVEYSFMTSQSSSSLPGESKGYQYDVNTGQSFDSSFWLGRDALMPNVTAPNQEPTVCMWCRNEFYQDPIPTGAQTGGAIGSMCPDCSSRVVL